jgi:transposase IS200 family protein
VLEQVRRRYEFVVGYVVMPEHIHLLISEPQKNNPSTVMRALKLGFARRVLAQARRRRNPSPPADRGPVSQEIDNLFTIHSPDFCIIIYFCSRGEGEHSVAAAWQLSRTGGDTENT